MSFKTVSSLRRQIYSESNWEILTALQFILPVELKTESFIFLIWLTFQTFMENNALQWTLMWLYSQSEPSLWILLKWLDWNISPRVNFITGGQDASIENIRYYVATFVCFLWKTKREFGHKHQLASTRSYDVEKFREIHVLVLKGLLVFSVKRESF